MAFIERIEFTLLKQTLKNKFTYLVWGLFLASFFVFGSSVNVPLFIFIAFIFSIIVMIDLKHFLILDTTQIILFIIANILLLESNTWINGYLGALLGLFLFGSIYFVYDKLLGKEAIGFGDVKLFANAGLFVGVLGFNYFLWIVTAFSLVVIFIRLFIKKKSKLIPYGPIIVISLWICLLFEKQLFNWFYNFINNVTGA